MSFREWPANDYAIGSFIQASVAEKFLPCVQFQPDAKVIDIGCGNGTFTQKILAKVPEGAVLGVDASENMLELAADLKITYPNFSVQKADVTALPFKNDFDGVVSFWCLQWVAQEIQKAFSNLHQALKPGGKIYTLFPAGNDPFIEAYRALKAAGNFPALNDFVPPMDYSGFDNLETKLKTLPFKALQVEKHSMNLELPSLEIYKKFVNGIAFYQGQMSDAEVKAVNEAMVDYFEEMCQKDHRGRYIFWGDIYWVYGEK